MIKSLHGMFIAAALLTTPVAANPPKSVSNVADFNFVIAKVKENYAGWEAKTSGPKKAALDALSNRLREDVARGDEAVLRRALAEWIAWFDDGHLQVQWAGATTARPWNVAPRAISEAAANARLAALGTARSPVEGIWSIDDRYRLVVLRHGRDARLFDAIVMATNAEGWKPGDVKAVLTAGADGRFDVRYGAGDRTELALEARLRSRGDVLELGEFGIWRRVEDDPAKMLAAERRWPGEDFVLRRLDADTLYLRLPSFNNSHAVTVRELMAAHAQELRRTPQLIIDLRGNGGGSDFVYDPVLPYLYTRPIWRIGVEVRVSKDNMRLRREVADRINETSSAAAKILREESDRMQTATTSFIRREPPVEIVRLGEVLPNPARIAILVDRAGSSAENFILDARQSSKVVLMGQENSAGVIDNGEMMAMQAPSGRFSLAWATTRSLRLPNDPVDPDGIAPEVLIPADIDDPILWSANWLKHSAP